MMTIAFVKPHLFPPCYLLEDDNTLFITFASLSQYYQAKHVLTFKLSHQGTHTTFNAAQLQTGRQDHYMSALHCPLSAYRSLAKVQITSLRKQSRRRTTSIATSASGRLSPSIFNNGRDVTWRNQSESETISRFNSMVKFLKRDIFEMLQRLKKLCCNASKFAELNSCKC